MNKKTHDFVKERVESIELTYSHCGTYVVTLRPEFKFDSYTAPNKMSFATKEAALREIYNTIPVTP